MYYQAAIWGFVINGILAYEYLNITKGNIQLSVVIGLIGLSILIFGLKDNVEL